MDNSLIPPVNGLRLTGAAAILRVLAAAGITEVFGLASGKLSPLFRAMAEAPGIRFTGVRHEAAAGFMAASHYAATGRMALCLGETGPGGMNLFTGLGGAHANNQAVLAITSSNPMPIMAPIRGAFSSTDNERLFGCLTKWNATVRDGARVPELLHRAMCAAQEGRPGPVHLDIPTEVLSREWDYDPAELDAPRRHYRPFAPGEPAAAAIAAAAGLLASARRPLLIGGGGAVHAGGAPLLRKLAEIIGAPAITTQMGLGVIASDAPYFIGQGGFVGGSAVVRALREADVVLAVGCRFSSFMWTEGPPRWNDHPARQLIQIDIDPQQMGRNMPVTLGLVGDAHATLAQLLPALAGQPLAIDADWTAGLVAERARYRDELARQIDAPAAVMHPGALARGVAGFIGAEDFVTFDGGHTSFWSNEFTPALHPATRFHEPGMAHLGFGLPAAVALARCFPDRRSFCLTGDGAFGFTVQELDTARRYGARVITVVHNNAAWGVIRAAQSKSGFEMGTDLGGTDYAAIARGFGCHGERLETPEQLGPAMRRALLAETPAVIAARVAFVPHPMMRFFGASTQIR